jgi:hypothetical protein
VQIQQKQVTAVDGVLIHFVNSPLWVSWLQSLRTRHSRPARLPPQNGVRVRVYHPLDTGRTVRHITEAGPFNRCAVVSRSDVLSRRSVGDRMSDMIRSVRRRAIDKFERDWK